MQKPIYLTLLSNSKRHFYYQNYQYAILESVIALETVIYRFLESKYREKGVSDSKIKQFLSDAGLTNEISVVILPFIPNENQVELAKLISKCKGAITLRNKIAHKGYRDFEIKQVANYIKSIERLIEILENNAS